MALVLVARRLPHTAMDTFQAVLHRVGAGARVVGACARKEVLTSITERSVLIQSISLPVNYLIMMSLYVLAGSHAPTAVVMQDHGPHARQFVAAMAHSASYRLGVETARQAAAQM